MYGERRDEDWINPPEPKEEYEPDYDAINDRKKIEEEERQQQIIESCCQPGDIK